jgi:hypothetical protein
VRAVNRSWVLVVASLLALWGAAAATPASANDANNLPPQVKLTAAGTEGIIGPKHDILARFQTEAPDPSWEYAPDSQVSFSCQVDSRSVPCVGIYDGCCRAVPVAVPLRPTTETPSAKPLGLGDYSGQVAVPKGLSSGTHTVTVTATDEDGTGPPASVEVAYDTTPPSAPELIQVPPLASHVHKPIFRYTATDDVRLVGSRREEFRSQLRRLNPPEVIYRERRESGYIGSWVTHCQSLLTCAGRSQAMYEGFQRSYGIGVPEWLPAGRYEFSVYARDAVGNESPPTAYRFRILPGRRR